MLVMNKALNMVINRINKNVLNLAFMRKVDGIRPNSSLEEQIKSLVIKPTVLLDCNIARGVTIAVDVGKCNQNLIEYDSVHRYLSIEVPYNLTNEREILQALTLTYTPIALNNPFDISRNQGLNMASRSMDMLSGKSAGLSTSSLELIGPNTILVHESIFNSVGGSLRVTVENNANLRNINIANARIFSKLVLLAVKGYIHNELDVDLDKGYLYGGQELSKIRDIVDSYSDAWDEYDELLNTKWKKISYMNDIENYARDIKLLIPTSI